MRSSGSLSGHFNGEKSFIEDITLVFADYQTLILKAIDELREGSLVVMKEFGATQYISMNCKLVRFLAYKYRKYVIFKVRDIQL